MIKLEYSPADAVFVLIKPGAGSLVLTQEETEKLRKLLDKTLYLNAERREL